MLFDHQHSSTVEYLLPSGSLDFKITSCTLFPFTVNGICGRGYV